MRSSRERALFTAGLFVAVAIVAWQSLRLSDISRVAPLTVAAPVMVLLLGEFVRDLLRTPDGRVRRQGVVQRREGSAFGALALLVGLVLGAGVFIGALVFLVWYLRSRARERWRVVVAVTSLAAVILGGLFGFLLGVDLIDIPLWRWLQA